VQNSDVMQKIKNACGVIDTACTIFAFENQPYLGEFEAEFKKALARESGAQGVLFYEKKTEGRKSRDAVPLNTILFVSCYCMNCFMDVMVHIQNVK
jgi:hypothetical protein